MRCQEVRTETTSGSLQNVNASFMNTYAGDGDNDVEQEVSLFIPDPEAVKESPVWVRDVIPQRVDPDLPVCTLGDPEVYPSTKATQVPVTDTSQSEVVFYAGPSKDVRPELSARLKSNGLPGSVEVSGPGIYGKLLLSPEGPTRKRLCGEWAWSSFGYYKFDFKVENAEADLEYRSRRHIAGASASFDEFPITLNLTVRTTVAGNGVKVLTDTALYSKNMEGKLVVSLDNVVYGDDNVVSQTAKSRIDQDPARDDARPL